MKWLKGLEDHRKSGRGKIACRLARYHNSNGVHWSYVSWAFSTQQTGISWRQHAHLLLAAGKAELWQITCMWRKISCRCIYSTLQENQLALLDIWRNFVKHLCMQAGMHNNLGCQYQGES